MGILGKLRSAAQRHDLGTLIQLLVYNAMLATIRVARRNNGVENDSFDREHGTETAVPVEIGDLDIPPANARFAVRYQASSANTVRQMIGSLAIDTSEFTFVDFGSGKGRVLLVAAEYPFKEIVGVEFAPALHAIAVQNILRSRENSRIKTLCTDVSTFDLPEQNIVAYLYNPFGAPIIAQVAHRLAYHCSKGYRVFVLYFNPRHRDIFEKIGCFDVIDENGAALVLECKHAMRDHKDDMLACPD